MKKLVFALASLVALFGCSGDSGSAADGAGGSGGVGGGCITCVDAGAGGEGGGAGGMGGAGGEAGAGGAGGSLLGMESSVDERCPDAQTGDFLLVVYPDRVDAYRQFEFSATYFCKFLALDENGLTNVTGMARSRDNSTFYVVQPEEGKGSVYAFDANGSFSRLATTNVNLDGVAGIWNDFGDKFIVWSATSQNLYELGDDASYRLPFSPEIWSGSRVPGITDILFLDDEAMLATFSDRSPKLFKRPFAPDWPADEIGPANAVTGVATEEGTKLLMTAQIGGIGNAYGVVLYDPAISGRVPPEQERVMVSAGSGEIIDGIDIMVMDSGFMVMDSDLAGTAKLTSFNQEGVMQQVIPLEGGGNPIMMMSTRIFPDF